MKLRPGHLSVIKSFIAVEAFIGFLALIGGAAINLHAPDATKFFHPNFTEYSVVDLLVTLSLIPGALVISLFSVNLLIIASDRLGNGQLADVLEEALASISWVFRMGGGPK